MFKKETRYIVFKKSDVEKHFGSDDLELLYKLKVKSEKGRKLDGKQPLCSLVIESDWPEYDIAWNLIENRVEHKSTIYRAPPRKTKIDWSYINSKFKYFAIDKSGAEMLYSEKPTLSVGAWECNPNSRAQSGFLLSDKVIQIGDEPWQESLIERPDGE